MEEKILKMLKNIDVYYDVATKCQIDGHKAAKEITSMVMEFVEWLIHNTVEATTYSPMVYLKYETKEEVTKYDQTFNFTKEWHLSDVFQYWFKNIKK